MGTGLLHTATLCPTRLSNRNIHSFPLSVMSSLAVSAAVRPRPASKSRVGLYHTVEHTPRARKRRQPTADVEGTLVLSSSAPSLTMAAAATSNAITPPVVRERALMATICAIIASTPHSSSTSTSASCPSPPPSEPALTPAVVLSAPPARWNDRDSKRSKAPVLASPWSGHSHDSFRDWIQQQDGTSPASYNSSQQLQPTHMQRRSSLPCFPFPASSFPASPTSDSSGSSSLHSFPSVPSEPSRLQSAPSSTRSQCQSSLLLDGVGSAVVTNYDAAVACGVNKFENLQLRLAAHPAIQRLQQLEETHCGEQQVNIEEEEDEAEEEVAELEEQFEPQLIQQQVEQMNQGNFHMMSTHAHVLSSFPMAGLPVVDETEHAPLAGLVTAFPFVQQFFPQPSRAEKKKQFIERIHASHQLTIHNNHPPTVVNVTRLGPLAQPTYPVAHPTAELCHSPVLPAALPTPFRSVSSSPTVSSDDSHEELSSEHDSYSCTQADCTSSALADTFASLSPNFVSTRAMTGFSFPPPAQPAAPYFLSPALTSSTCPLPILHSPVLPTLHPVFSSSPTLQSSYDFSLCPDDLQLGERAWDDGGHWMGDW